MDTAREQRALKLSIAMTVLIGVGGVLVGLVTASQAIIFDAMYSFVDVVLTLASLVVSRLLARERSHRFQYGYFHLEPLVTTLGGATLAIACLYAIVTAAHDLMSGGHLVEFRKAGIWAALLSVCGVGLSLYFSRLGRALNSSLLALDARSWMVTGLLSIALLTSFMLATLLRGTALDAKTPYIDPLMLLVIAVAVLPVPMLTVVRAMREVLQLAPDELDHQVHAVMSDVIARQGFIDFSSHVAKIGRTRFVEIHVLVTPEFRMNISAADDIRREVASRLNARWPHFWLTIDFTADRAWM
jgi:cation diffusion facilitator family transporter